MQWGQGWGGSGVLSDITRSLGGPLPGLGGAQTGVTAGRPRASLPRALECSPSSDFSSLILFYYRDLLLLSGREPGLFIRVAFGKWLTPLIFLHLHVLFSGRGGGHGRRKGSLIALGSDPARQASEGFIFAGPSA